MAHEFTTWAYRQDLPTMPKFVLVALADRADHNGYCWPSVKDIAQMTGQSERSVYNQLAILEGAGLIEIEERRRKDGYRASNGYTLKISPARRSPEPRSPEQVSPERDDDSHLHDVHPNINPPSEALSEPSIEPSACEDRFDDFWKAYPRKDGMIQSRQAFQDEVRRGADPDLIVRAAIAYARKKSGAEERYILLPANWLSRQTYRDPGLDRPEPKPIDLSALEEWKQPIAERLGAAFVAAWLEGAIRDGPSLQVPTPLAQSFLTERYGIDLSKFGITEIIHRTTTETP